MPRALTRWVRFRHAGGSLSLAPSRLLRRSRRDRVLAGVCGGLGAYLGVDPNAIAVAESYERSGRPTVSTQNQVADYAYAYDGDSNITSFEGIPLTYNASNEMTSAGAATFTYNASGDQTSSSDGLAFSYNAADQTTSVTGRGGQTQAMTYAGVGQSERVGAGTKTFTYWPGPGQPDSPQR